MWKKSLITRTLNTALIILIMQIKRMIFFLNIKMAFSLFKFLVVAHRNLLQGILIISYL